MNLRSTLSDARIKVSLADQSLSLFDGSSLHSRYAVSTAANGAGQRMGSECTPQGRHRIRAKIGAGAAPGTVFVGRRPTGEIFSESLADEFPDRDWILTRILWLCGEQPGFNRLGSVDTMRRYIYIHGAPHADAMGTPGSHGCIKMHNAEVMKVFDLVDVGTPVLIQ